MKQVADGVWQLRGFPPNAIDVSLAEDVLIDAGTGLRQTRHRVWVVEKEVPYAERPERFRDIQSSYPYTRLVTRFGHSPGHVAFWRERDGVLISATWSTT